MKVLDPGLQTTIQAGPRDGHRHLGVATGGPADPLALALANRLVGNAPDAPGLEVTLTGLRLRMEAACGLAVAGAPRSVTLDGRAAPAHEALNPRPGDELRLGPAPLGCRSYVAFAGGLVAATAFGSASTDRRAGIGGHDGRALLAGDRLTLADPRLAPDARTPEELRPAFAPHWTLRAAPGPEISLLNEADTARLFGEGFTAGRDSDRTGVRLSGPHLTAAEANMDSAPVFVGTVQLPPGGRPIILLPDAGTTGGYPRVAQVIRADRHLLGQLRPGHPVRLLRRTPEQAAGVLRAKTALLQGWLGDAFRL